MKINSSLSLAAGFGLMLTGPVFAHHSFAAQYDRDRPVTLVGPVTKIDWINPHARFFVDVKDANGHVGTARLDKELSQARRIRHRECVSCQGRFQSCECLDRDPCRRSKSVRGIVRRRR